MLSRLKEHFYAAMPVIGPHAGIDAELMLAGKKPICILPVFEYNPNEEFIYKKRNYDRLRLDKAVEEGQLVSTDRFIQGGDQRNDFTMRFYAQPHKEQEMKEFADNYLNFEKLKKDHGRYLGYRRRDVMLWYAPSSLPSRIINPIYALSRQFKTAHRNTLLRNAGIEDPDQYCQRMEDKLDRNDLSIE